METYLTNFQSDLGAVSAEIETLQSRSAALNTQLENRKVVEKLLGPAVEEIGLSPVVVRKISEGPIDEGFLKAIAELEKRSKTINAKTKEQDTMKALEDIKPILDDLTNKVLYSHHPSLDFCSSQSRRSNGYVTTLSLRLKPSDPQASMLK